MGKHHFLPILAVFGRFFVKIADLIWLKFYKTHTTHVPYDSLPCIKIFSRYSSINTLNLSENLEKRRFLTLFFQSCPVSGQYRPDGWSDRSRFYFKTFPQHECFERCITFPIFYLPFLIITVPYGRTDRRTDRHSYFISIYGLGLRPSIKPLRG